MTRTTGGAAPTGTATTPRSLHSQILTPPFVVVSACFAAFFALGAAGVPPLDNWPMPARGALAVMFLFTASARLTPARADLVAMVPRSLPRPGALVAATGVLEAAGAVGLLVPATATPARGAWPAFWSRCSLPTSTPHGPASACAARRQRQSRCVWPSKRYTSGWRSSRPPRERCHPSLWRRLRVAERVQRAGRTALARSLARPDRPHERRASGWRRICRGHGPWLLLENAKTSGAIWTGRCHLGSRTETEPWTAT